MPENNNPARVYGLSFVPRGQGRDIRHPPEIVFRVASAHVESSEANLRNPLLYQMVPAISYLKEHEPFQFPDQGLLFSDMRPEFPRCGFRNCAYFIDLEEGREYHLPLVRKHRGELVLTLNALLVAHNQGIYQEYGVAQKANRTQLLELHTWCKTGGHYAHGVHGSITPTFRQWLHRQAELLPGEFCNFTESKPLMPEVKAAIAEAYAVLVKSKFKKMDENDCFGIVTRNGRFLLHCPGNACDIAIYPDHDLGPEEDYPTRFSCHNLDAAEQQLALIAGLAALCDIAGKDLG